MRQIEKIVMLQTLDSLWKDHLLAMDHLKEGIGLRGYGQQNPLVEYQKEGFDDVRSDDAGDAAGRGREGLLGAGAARAGRRSRSSSNSSAPQRVVMSHGGETVERKRRRPSSAKATRSAATTRALAAPGKKYKRCHGK